MQGSACKVFPSQSPHRSTSYTQPTRVDNSIPSHSPPEPVYDPESQHLRRSRAGSQSLELRAVKLTIPEESPELPSLTFSPLSLDTDTHNTPSPTHRFPSPSEMAPVPIISSPTDFNPSLLARSLSPRQVGQAIENVRRSPLTATEIAEIGTSLFPFRPTPFSKMSASPPTITQQQLEDAEVPPQISLLGPMISKQSGFLHFHTPSLSRVTRNVTKRLPSTGSGEREIPTMPALPNAESSPTPLPLKFKKSSPKRPAVPAVKTKDTSSKKFTSAKDLPFNYISLPSEQSPSSPSATEAPSSCLNPVARTSSGIMTYLIPSGEVHPQKRQNTIKAPKTLMVAGSEVKLTHNHSREWSDSDRQHVMSWATYSPLMEGIEHFSPMVEDVA